MESKKFSKNNIFKSILKKASKILYDILIIFCIALILVVVWQIVTDNNESIGGYRLFRIISGSMVPEFNVDEVVVCKDTNPENIKIGDIIVYRGKTGELTNRLIMHEVIDKNEVEGNLIFHVKGIQNTTGDPDVYSSQILGVVVHKSKILTLLYSLATSRYSSFIIIIVLVINVFVSFIPKREEVITLDEPKKESKSKIVINKSKRYTLKDFDRYIKIIRKDYEIENKNQVESEEDVGQELDENDKIKEENKRLEEEIKKLKEEMKKKK